MLHNLAAALFILLVTQLVPRSEQSSIPEDDKVIELTEKSISRFATRLAGGSTDPLVAELQSHPAANKTYRKLFSRYLVGSIAIFGKVDECGLRTIRGLCSKERVMYLSDLLDRLERENSLDTIALSMAEVDGRTAYVAYFGELIGKLIKENWSAMERLAMRTLAVLESRGTSRYSYRLILRQLPAEQQYKLINAGKVPLSTIDYIYNFEDDRLLLREMLFLARYSCSPNPDIRKCITDNFCSKQYVADYGTVRIKKLRHADIPTLNSDVLHRISKFMDVETLMVVMHLVCRTWRNLHWKILKHDAEIHGMYLSDLDNISLKYVHASAPWKYYMRSRTSALEYFGRCLDSSTPSWFRSKCLLQKNARRYMRAVTEGRTCLPRTEGCTTQYDAFVKLFGRVYESCNLERVIFDKPEFFTDEEYEQAIYHFVYERKWVLRLPGSFIVDNMPRLYSIIKEDDELMKKLVEISPYTFMDASLALIMYGQTRTVSDKLARLIFCQTDLFRQLAEPTAIPCTEYYNSVFEFGILPEVVKRCCHRIGIVSRFLISFVSSFRNSPEMVDRIEMSITSRFAGPDDPGLRGARRWLETVPLMSSMASEGYSAEDFNFFKRVMVRCGLL